MFSENKNKTVKSLFPEIKKIQSFDIKMFFPQNMTLIFTFIEQLFYAWWQEKDFQSLYFSSLYLLVPHWFEKQLKIFTLNQSV